MIFKNFCKRAAALTAALILTVPMAGACIPAQDTVYGAVLENTSETEGEVLLTTGSPFTDETYTHENKFEGYEVFNGIDVSKWNNYQVENGEIDWAACKEAGVDFVFIRVGYRAMATGKLIEDPYFKQNIEGALANDISVGVYFFSEAITTKEAKEEAKFVIKRIQDYDVTLPIVFDYEGGTYTVNGVEYPGRVEQAYRDGTLNKTVVTKIARAYLNYVEDAGYTAMMYSSSNGLINHFEGESLGEDYQVWQARYATSTNPKNGFLYYKGNYSYWQYASDGTVAGMTTDCNFLYKNFNVKTNEPYDIDQTADSITLAWEETDDALGYYVYRLDPDTGKYKKIATTRDSFYIDSDLAAATEYSYRLLAYWKIGGKTYTAKKSSVLTCSTTVKTVKDVTVDARTDSSITLSWKAVGKAKGYVVYMYDKSEEYYVEVASVSGKNNTTCTVTGLDASKKYSFVVSAYRNYDGERLIGEWSDEIVALTKPTKVKTLTSTEESASSVSIKFTKQARVTGYNIYRYNDATGKWKKIGTSTDGTFTDDTVAANTTYKYRVRAYRTYKGVTYKGKYSATLTVKTAKK